MINETQVTNRQRAILIAVIDLYISAGEPVGSQSVARVLDVGTVAGLSSAISSGGRIGFGIGALLGAGPQADRDNKKPRSARARALSTVPDLLAHYFTWSRKPVGPNHHELMLGTPGA